jgi:hypothetical protein
MLCCYRSVFGLVHEQMYDIRQARCYRLTVRYRLANHYCFVYWHRV